MKSLDLKMKDAEKIEKFLGKMIRSKKRTFPAKVELLLIKNYSSFVESVNILQDFKNSLVAKYGVLQPDGTYKMDNENKENLTLYQKELNQFLEMTIKINIQEINIEDFDGFKSIGFEYAQNIYMFIEF